MDTVTVSADFQIEIPPLAREFLGLKPGQKIQIILYNNRLEFIPIQPMSQMRGFL